MEFSCPSEQLCFILQWLEYLSSNKYKKIIKNDINNDINVNNLKTFNESRRWRSNNINS